MNHPLHDTLPPWAQHLIQQKEDEIYALRTGGDGKCKPKHMKELMEFLQALGVRDTRAEAEEIADYFNSNGWKVGNKAPMKDWRAAIRRWVRNNPKSLITGRKTKGNNLR